MTQKLQVMKHGYLSHPFAVANFGVSPSAINEHIDAWRKLAYRRIDKIAFADNSGIWDLFGGVWAQGIVDSATRMTRRFLFHKLPSIAKGTDILTWEFEDVGMDVRDFRIDPDRDLMALIESPLRYVSCVLLASPPPPSLMLLPGTLSSIGCTCVSYTATACPIGLPKMVS
jgi:hypothetical protein